MLQDTLKCARMLVRQAEASVSPEAVVAAANEVGLLLKRNDMWVLDRALLANI